MKLWEHPLLFYRRISSWPPVWMQIYGQEDKTQRWWSAASLVMDSRLTPIPRERLESLKL